MSVEDRSLEPVPWDFWAQEFWRSLAIDPAGEDTDASAQSVLSIEIDSGDIQADVQAARFESYHVSIRIAPFTESQWESVLEAFASQAIYSARLLSGELSPDVCPFLEARGIFLIPRSGQLEARCDCDVDGDDTGSTQPCSHLFAVYRSIADRLDEEPFLLLTLRGRSRSAILRSLNRWRARQGSGDPNASVTPLEQSLDGFWKPGPELDELRVRVGPPRVSAALLKRLGLPSFWQPHPEIRGSLERLYIKVTERAMALAYQGKGMDSVAGESPDDSEEDEPSRTASPS